MAMTITTNKIKLLIADDDADDRKLFVEAVAEIDKDIECITASDGEQALQILEDLSTPLPHIIFLDLRMPKLNGKKCLSQIKSSPRLKHIPVIVYTTSKQVEESQELQELGATHFISKPSDPDEIFYVISLVLEEELKDRDRKEG